MHLPITQSLSVDLSTTLIQSGEVHLLPNGEISHRILIAFTGERFRVEGAGPLPERYRLASNYTVTIHPQKELFFA